MTLGTDFFGDRDLHPAMTIVEGNLAVAHCIIRRIRTDSGALPEFPEYGYNLMDKIGAAGIDVDVVRDEVEEQCYQEEEVEDVTVTVTLDNLVLRVVIQIETAEGPFEFTVLVDQLGVSAIFPEA